MPFWKGLHGAIKIYVIWLSGSDSCELSATVFLSKIALLTVQFSWLQIYFFPWCRSTIKVKAEGKTLYLKMFVLYQLVGFHLVTGEMWMGLGELDTAIVWEEKISLAYGLCTRGAIGCFWFFSGLGIGESHHFWSLSTSGFFLLQNSPWMNVLPQSAWHWGSCFGLSWQSLVSHPVSDARWEHPEDPSVTQEGSGALQGSRGADPAWGLGNISSLSRQLLLSRKKCSELWRVKRLKMNAFHSKGKIIVFIPRKVWCFPFSKCDGGK